MISNGDCAVPGCRREDRGRADGLCRKHSQLPARNLVDLSCEHGYCDCRRTDRYIGRHRVAALRTAATAERAS